MSRIDQRHQIGAQLDDLAQHINVLLDGDGDQRRQICQMASLCDRARSLYRPESPTRAALLVAARALWWIATHDVPTDRQAADR